MMSVEVGALVDRSIHAIVLVCGSLPHLKPRNGQRGRGSEEGFLQYYRIAVCVGLCGTVRWSIRPAAWASKGRSLGTAKPNSSVGGFNKIIHPILRVYRSPRQNWARRHPTKKDSLKYGGRIGRRKRVPYRPAPFLMTCATFSGQLRTCLPPTREWP